MKAQCMVADSEMSVAKLYTYQNEGNFVLEAIIEHHTYICVMKRMRKQKIVDAGWSVQFVIGGIIWTAAELWSVRTPTLKSLILIYKLCS